ncbi:tetraacyldisaccharide 4'-kinase [bacterium]|nr:tetraacyldisaccharide 4'-kinase [candidate division CSSED10-310 bacterium]
MQGPDWLLSPLSRLYGFLTGYRNALYEKQILTVRHVPVPVISIGNLAVGGTGKTPCVMWLAQRLVEQGMKPIIISRGYRGRLGKQPTRVPPDGSFADYGDEPCLLARSLAGVPVVISHDRVKGAQWCLQRFSPSCFLLDDGFQHRRISRIIDIVMLDSRYPFSGDCLLPAGRLRESPTGLERADFIIYSHCDESDLPTQDLAYLSGLKVSPIIFKSFHKPIRLRPIWTFSISTQPSNSGTVGLVSAIGSPAAFRKSAEEFGLSVAYEKHFADHEVVTSDEWMHMAKQARDIGCTMLVTTAKDESRFPAAITTDIPVFVLDIALTIENDDDLMKRILDLVKTNEKA